MQPWDFEADPDTYEYVPYAALVPEREIDENAAAWLARICSTAASLIQEHSGTPDDAAAIMELGRARIQEWQGSYNYWIDYALVETLTS